MIIKNQDGDALYFINDKSIIKVTDIGIIQLNGERIGTYKSYGKGKQVLNDIYSAFSQNKKAFTMPPYTEV